MANFYTDIPELKYHLNNPMMERICQLKERDYRAVSYTHLDVYKRQSNAYLPTSSPSMEKPSKVLGVQAE